MASNTVDVLLIANGLAKKELLTNFTQIERNLDNLKLLAGRAAPEEILALQGGDEMDDSLAKSIADMLRNPKSLTGAALKKRTGSKPAKVSKKKEADEGEENSDGPAASKLSAKAKGKRKAVEPPEFEGDAPAPIVKATGSKKRKAKSRPTVEESDNEDGEGEPEGRKTSKARPKPQPKKRKLGELAARAEAAQSIDHIWDNGLPGQAGPSGTQRESPALTPSIPQLGANPSGTIEVGGPLPQQMIEPEPTAAPSMQVPETSSTATVPPLSPTGLEIDIPQIPEVNVNDQEMEDSDGTDYPHGSPTSRAKERGLGDAPMEGIEAGPGLQPEGENSLGAPDAFDGALTPLTVTQPPSSPSQAERDEDAAARIRPQYRGGSQPNAEAGPSSSQLVGEKAEYIPRKPARSSQRVLVKKKFGKKPLAGSKRGEHSHAILSLEHLGFFIT
ncbi:hypothetical protein F5890DRAFT_1478842 [Lentinula detonsa]|uniref:Uncharacterized protein n=1 Tax=Lentinula detonsa TaxID=2804962 RepID=A0AA38PNV9_9AGAR|nr:hypothetical protein F5890DRAFT_1478842 [Lentinula detonsa]